MRWLVKPEAEIDNTRQCIKFAWFPIQVENYWLWLEYYYVEQVYAWQHDPVSGTSYPEWQDTLRRFINK